MKNECSKRINQVCDSVQLLEHKKKYGGKVYINIFTLELVCFFCNIEILDETFTKDEKMRIVTFKSKIRMLVCELIRRCYSRAS